MKSGWTVLFVLFVKSKPSPYFEFDDMFNTECIPTDHLKDYLYYGKVSTYIERSGLMTSSPSPAMRSASSVLGRCEIWKSVVNVMVQWAINHSIKDYWTYPDEFMSHDNCRNFDLTQKDKNSNDHLAVRMKIIEPNASAVGPWCYSYDSVHEKYYVARCFPECIGSNYHGAEKPTHRPKIVATSVTKSNYNVKLIDSIAAKTFNKYDWGPFTYYDSRPSSTLLSAEFKKNRYSIFFAMIGVGITAMMCSILFVVTRNYIKTKKKEGRQEKIISKKIPKRPWRMLKLTVGGVAVPASSQVNKSKQEMGTPV